MLPAAPADSPARVAAAIAALLAGHGLTRIYTAACQLIAVISVTADLTAWTNGRQVWVTHDGQRETWPAARAQAAAARLAELARPGQESRSLVRTDHHACPRPAARRPPGLSPRRDRR
jgi:hypothetical protein